MLSKIRIFIAFFFVVLACLCTLQALRTPTILELLLCALIFLYGSWMCMVQNRNARKKKEALPPLPGTFQLPDPETDGEVHSTKTVTRSSGPHSRSVSVRYESDSWKLILPFVIFMTILFAVISFVVIHFDQGFGLIFSSMSLVILTLLWLDLPFGKWKKQIEKEQQSKI